MTPDDPRHGIRAGYIAGCRQPCCNEPHYRYQKRSRLRQLREGSQTIPATQTLARIQWWDQRGVRLNALHEAAGLGYGTLAEITNGTRDVCLRSTERGVLRVTWDTLPDKALCYSGLTKIRIYSLMASGHPLAWITSRVDGLPISGRWRTQERCTLRLARAIMRLAIEAPAAGASKQTAVKARHRGYEPIAAWDDPGYPAMPFDWLPTGYGMPALDVDENVISRVLSGDVVSATRGERTEIFRLWVKAGRPLRELEALTGWRADRYYRIKDVA